MILLLIIPIWTVALVLVAGLCAGARLGDNAQLEARMQSAPDGPAPIALSDERGHGVRRETEVGVSRPIEIAV